MLSSILLVAAGIGLLYWGGELLIENSIRLAKNFGVSSLVIGLTVVAFATSAPELATTLTAALRGSPDIAVGNVIGSNIANLGLILGLSAAIFLLVAMLGIFLATQLREQGSEEEDPENGSKSARPVWLLSLLIAVGVGLLVGGAQALVTGASNIARAAGVSDRVIGLTLVALGTSLPELAAAVVAARRRLADLVLGNVIGSNIFNLLCILGITSMVHPISVAPQALRLDFWVMLAISILVLVCLALRRRLQRLEGLVLLAIYLGYTVFLYRV